MPRELLLLVQLALRELLVPLVLQEPLALPQLVLLVLRALLEPLALPELLPELPQAQLAPPELLPLEPQAQLEPLPDPLVLVQLVPRAQLARLLQALPLQASQPQRPKPSRQLSLHIPMTFADWCLQ